MRWQDQTVGSIGDGMMGKRCMSTCVHAMARPVASGEFCSELAK